MAGDAPIEVESRRWGNQLPAPFGDHLSAETYAASLVEYAAGRLDAHGLHAWLVWRLVVDGALAHDEAEAVAIATIARERARVAHSRPLRRPHPPRRPQRPSQGRRRG